MMHERVSVEKWVADLFGKQVGEPPRPWVQGDEPVWTFDADEYYALLEPERKVELLSETFERSGELLAPYSDAQINQALWWSVVGGGSEYIHVIKDESVPWDKRRRAVWSFVPLFEQVMAKRCSETLSQFDEEPASPLNSFCYMWWDTAPICSTRTVAGDPRLDDECLAVMERILRIHHVACQESALHGLGHWAFEHKEDVEKIIDNFQRREPNLRADLIDYVEAAKAGCIQ
jgi:hypothetical protein